jgi:hypothetical protein
LLGQNQGVFFMASAPIRPFVPRNPGVPTAAEQSVILRILVRHGYPPPHQTVGNAGIAPHRTW